MTMSLTSSVFVGRQDDPCRSQRGGGGEARWHPTSGAVVTSGRKYQRLKGGISTQKPKIIRNLFVIILGGHIILRN